MSTFSTSRGTRGQHVSPRHDRPYRPSPARREAIHGRVQGLPDRRDPTARLFIALAIVIAGYFIVQEARPLLSAASVVHQVPRTTGSTVPLTDARRDK